MKKIVATLSALILSTLPMYGHTEVAATPKIDVVFALDTTGSMGGLIQGAKEKIWSIASTMAQGKPSPKIRIGLLAYRDRGDSYVTTKFPLTDDLDAMYSKLMSFTADGGGDGPESVNQALQESVRSFEWSKEKDVYRVVFLVGDAPPHMDYQDDIKYTQTVSEALKSGIIINTVQCGTDNSTTQIWKEIANKGEGKFVQVAQNGSVATAVSPYDEKLSTLSSELEGTRMYYGDKGSKDAAKAREGIASSIRASAPAAAKAGRAAWNASDAGKMNLLGKNELLDKIESKEIDLATIKKDELPTELQSMTPEAREKHVQAQLKKRNDLKVEIEKLSKQRQRYLSEQVKAKGEDTSSLDAQLYRAIKEQAGKKGIDYTSGPTY